MATAASMALDGLGLTLRVDAATGAVSAVRLAPAGPALASPVAVPGTVGTVPAPDAGGGVSAFLVYAAVGFCATLGCLLILLVGCTASRAVRARRVRAQVAADVEAAVAAAPSRPPKPSFLVLHPGDGAACVAVASSPDACARKAAGAATPPAAGAKAGRPRRPLSGLIPAVRALRLGGRPESAAEGGDAVAAASPASPGRRPDPGAHV
jgi:hypothetical protein